MMQTRQQERYLTREMVNDYAIYLRRQEKSPSTIQQYVRALCTLAAFLAGTVVTSDTLCAWKKNLEDKIDSHTYKTTTVNAMLNALNGFLRYQHWDDLLLKPLKVQKSLFAERSKELTRAEYERLVRTAQDQGNERLSLVIQTICATGIRVSELRFITVEAVRTGHTEVKNKGKRRTIFLPEDLRNLLRRYIRKQGILSGSVFVSRNGKPLNRTNIWRDMKKLCRSANVEPGKVFPHNLRHLFARRYYTLHQDLSRLADILGHSSINTTRIYTMESGEVHARQVERLGLIIS